MLSSGGFLVAAWLSVTCMRVLGALGEAFLAPSKFWTLVLELWVVSLPVAAGLSLLLARWVATQIDAPLNTIVQRSRRIGRDKVRWGFTPEPQSSLAPLASTLDEMMVRVRRIFEHQNQCLVDAAHELRTPLTAQALVAENALAREGKSADLREVVGSLLEEARYMQRLIENVLLLKRVGLKAALAKDQAELAPHNLTELARGCVNTLMVLAEEKRQTLTLRASGALWSRVDTTMTRQAILNVVHNAIEHCQPGARIEIDCKSIGESRGSVIISDDGPGIAREDQARVFSTFFRGSGTSRHRGLGLGLAIAKATLVQQGGSIKLHSHPGVGCIFELTFPLVAMPPPTQAARVFVERRIERIGRPVPA